MTITEMFARRASEREIDALKRNRSAGAKTIIDMLRASPDVQVIKARKVIEGDMKGRSESPTTAACAVNDSICGCDPRAAGREALENVVSQMYAYDDANGQTRQVIIDMLSVVDSIKCTDDLSK